jgi:hypothetical protein
MLRHADLGVLALALPVVLVAGPSLLGYAVAAAAWLIQSSVQIAAERAAARALASGVRRNALGLLGAAMLARLWVVTLGILLVGTLGSSRAGLTAAILSLVLVTVSLGGRALAHALHQEEG